MFLDFLDKEGNCQTINRITDEYTVTSEYPLKYIMELLEMIFSSFNGIYHLKASMTMNL